jgi:putative nucleotidyltransferase with HDIG domain
MKEEIKNMVLNLCNKQDWDWEAHIVSVVKYSKLLAKKLDADEEICELSAWLHDIKKIQGKREKHHVHGSKEAAKILKSYGYPNEKIKQVEHCILTHSADKNYVPETIEAKIVASADALSHFDNFLSLTYVVYDLRNLSIEEGRKWLIKKYESCWDKLDFVPVAKELAQDKYEAIKLILNE